MGLVGLSTSDKQKAAKPETLWTNSEIDLLVGSNPPTAAPVASSSVDKEEPVEKAVGKEAAAVDDLAAETEPAETEAAPAPVPESA